MVAHDPRRLPLVLQRAFRFAVSLAGSLGRRLVARDEPTEHPQQYYGRTPER